MRFATFRFQILLVYGILVLIAGNYDRLQCFLDTMMSNGRSSLIELFESGSRHRVLMVNVFILWIGSISPGNEIIFISTIVAYDLSQRDYIHDSIMVPISKNSLEFWR